MKKYTIILALAALLTACGKPAEAPAPSGPMKIEGVTVNNMVSTSIMAGKPGALTIQGNGFDALSDYVVIKWKDGDEDREEIVDNPSLDIRPNRISFGLDAYTDAKGKTVTVWLGRTGETEDELYEEIPISRNITVTTPTVADGFIPDQQFLYDLQLKNPSVTAMIGPCNLIDVAAAAALTEEPNPVEGWPFDISWSVAADWTGLELFSNLGNIPSKHPYPADEGMNVVGWYSNEITEVDFSKWTAPCKVRMGHCKKLQKAVGGPYHVGYMFDSCESLTYVDLHMNRFAHWIYLDGCPLEYLDIRRCQDGEMGKDFYHFCESGNVKIDNIQANAVVKIDSYYLIRHNVDSWKGIVDGWKKGATIEVYSCIDIDQKLGTVPAYTENPLALSYDNWDFKDGEEDHGYSSNGWRVDDPGTAWDESKSRAEAENS